jgi:hypothetical protein
MLLKQYNIQNNIELQVTQYTLKSIENRCYTGGWWHLNCGGWACGNGWSGIVANYILLWAVLPSDSPGWFVGTYGLFAKLMVVARWIS